MRVGQPEKTHGHIKWNDDHDRREHVGEKDQPRDRLAPMEAKAREAVGGGHRNKQRQANSGKRYGETVAEIREKTSLCEQPAKIVEVTCVGQSVGGVTKISREGFNAVDAIHAKGKAVKASSANAANISTWP